MAVLSKRAGEPAEQRREAEQSFARAVEELLAEGAPYAGLSVEQISRRAGRTRTAFYFYFRDKRELLVRLTTEVNAELMAAADTWWSGDADLREALRRIAALYAEHGPLLRAVVEVSTYDDAVATYWRELVGRFVDATRERIEADQAAGTAKDGPAGAMAFAMVWMVERAFYEQRVQDAPVAVDDLVEALSEIFTRSVYGA